MPLICKWSVCTGIKEIKDDDEDDLSSFEEELRRIVVHNKQFTLPANFIKLLDDK